MGFVENLNQLANALTVDVINGLAVVTANETEILAVADMQTEILSIFADKITLDSIYADKGTLDSIFADKATLDSIFADKATLDSLFTDKAVLDSLYADKAKLDSLYTDKITLDSLYADKATLDSLYADKITLDRLYASIDNVDTTVLNIANIDIVAPDIANVNTVATDIASVNTTATNIANVNTVATNIADVIGAKLRVWEAEAERLTADSYATEAEDTFVNIVTSDGDGTFTYTPTTDYSALHYSLKAATFNPALYEPADTTILKDADIGSTVQAYDAGLQSIAALTTAADKMVYTTASDTYAVTTLTAAGRALIDDTSAAAQRTTLGISATNTPSTAVGGVTATNVQAAIQELDSKKANLASPTLTGTPTAPTAAAGTNTTQIATTEFVNAEIANDTFSKTELTMAIGNINSPLLDMPLKNSLAMKAGVGSATFTRASTATYIDRYGVLKRANIDEPRFEKEGYLNEGSSTNLNLYSEFNGGYPCGLSAAWENILEVHSGITFNKYIAGAVRYKDYPTSLDYGSVSIFLYDDGVSDRTVMTRFEIKGDTTIEKNVTLNFDTKELNWYSDGVWTAKLEILSDNVYRVSISAGPTGVLSVTSYRLAIYGNASWKGGFQVEALPFATSYIPTTTAAVTRAQDYLTVSYENNLPDPKKGHSIILDVNNFRINSVDGYILYSSGYFSSMRYRAITNNILWSTKYTTQALITEGAIPNTTYRIAVTGKDGIRGSAYSNGTLASSNASHTFGYPSESLSLGHLPGYLQHLFGHISNVRIYDKVLSSQEIALC